MRQVVHRKKVIVIIIIADFLILSLSIPYKNESFVMYQLMFYLCVYMCLYLNTNMCKKIHLCGYIFLSVLCN